MQRVKHAKVSVEGRTVGEIGEGFCLLVGVAVGDVESDAVQLAEKIAHLRVFEDEEGKMNRSLVDVGGAILAVSQFTLYADCSRGRRPSFTDAMEPQEANRLYERFMKHLKAKNIKVEKGIFQANMDVELCNQGPVTMILESKKG